MKTFLFVYLAILMTGVKAETNERCFWSKDTVTCFSPEPSRQGEIVTVKLTHLTTNKKTTFRALVTGHSYTVWDGGRPDCKAWYPYISYSLTSKEYLHRLSGSWTNKHCGSHIEWRLNSLF